MSEPQVSVNLPLMDIDLAALPDDVETLHRMVRTLAADRTALSEAQAEIERLRLIVQKLQRSQFGRRAERLEHHQLQFGFEDLEADLARAEAELPLARTKTPSAARTGRLSLPAHLAREDRRIDIEHQACPCCGGPLHLIGETVSEMLDHVPARLRVICIRRPRYGCRGCGTIHQAPAPERPIAKGLATPVSWPTSWSPSIAITFRSTGRAKSSPGTASSSTARRSPTGSAERVVVGAAAGAARRARLRLAQAVRRRHADPGARSRPRPHQDRPVVGLCARRSTMVRPRPAGGRLPLQSRSQGRASRRHLARFSGVLQVDGYPGFERLRRGNIQLAACWAHARRKFYEVHQATGSPVAAEAFRRIAELYAIEATIRGQAAEARRERARSPDRCRWSSAMKTWLETELNRIPPRGGLAEAIRYALARWTALCRFLDDGRIELDNNTVERAIRPIALGRKNHLFAGSDGGAARWAIVASLLATAKLNDVEPFAYLKDVLERMSNGHPMSRLDELLPWNWAPSTAAAA